MNQILNNISNSFVTGANQLHGVLIPVTMLAVFAGILIIVNMAMTEKSVARIWPYLIRCIVAVILLGSLAGWGDMINGAVADVMHQTTFSNGPLSIAADYQRALAQKFGTNGAATAGQGVPLGETEGSTGSPQPSSGTKITAYGFQGDLTPDSNSANGIGNHGNQLNAFGGAGPASAALSADVAQQYGVQLGQQFSVTAANGNTYALVYADSPRKDLTGIIDIFDPNQLLTNGVNDNNFSSSATSVTNGGMTTTGNGEIAFPTFSMNPTTWGATIVEVVAYLLSILALTMMFIMTIFQNIAYLLMIAISPIMIGFMLLPALTPISTKFFTSLFSITLWPIGWILADLVSKLILTGITATSGNSAASMFGFGFAFGGWILLAIWIIVSSVVAPIYVSSALVSGGTGIVQVLASAAGITTMVAMRSASAAGITGSGGSGGNGSPATGQMNAPRFARRPGF
jgi:hypothetical protein